MHPRERITNWLGRIERGRTYPALDRALCELPVAALPAATFDELLNVTKKFVANYQGEPARFGRQTEIEVLLSDLVVRAVASEGAELLQKLARALAEFGSLGHAAVPLLHELAAVPCEHRALAGRPAPGWMTGALAGFEPAEPSPASVPAARLAPEPAPRWIVPAFVSTALLLGLFVLLGSAPRHPAPSPRPTPSVILVRVPKDPEPDWCSEQLQDLAFSNQRFLASRGVLVDLPLPPIRRR